MNLKLPVSRKTFEAEERRADHWKQKAENLEKELQETRENLQVKRHHAETIAGQLDVAQTEIDSLARKIEELEQTAQRRNTNIDRLREELNATRQKLSRLKGAEEELERTRERLTSIEKAQAKLKRLAGDEKSLERSITSLERQKQRLQEQNGAIRQAQDDMAIAFSVSLRKRETQLTAALTEKQEQIKEAESQLKELHQILEVGMTLSELQAAVDTLALERGELQDSVGELGEEEGRLKVKTASLLAFVNAWERESRELRRRMVGDLESELSQEEIDALQSEAEYLCPEECRAEEIPGDGGAGGDSDIETPEEDRPAPE